MSTLLSIIDRTGTEKIIKDLEELNTTTNQLDLIDIYRTFHSTNTLSFQAYIENSPRWTIS